MLPIIDFCWRGFEPDFVDQAKVGDLRDLAQAHESELFTVYDRILHWSALVVPEVIMETIGRHNLELSVPAAGVGLVDLLRRGQMAVSAQCPAGLAVRMAEWQEAQVIHAVDDDGLPRGLFVLDAVAERLPGVLYDHGLPELADETARSGLPGLGNAVSRIESVVSQFGSEQLNQHGPTPRVCQDHGLSHHVSSCPCHTHPTSVCGLRTVANRPAAAAAWA